MCNYHVVKFDPTKKLENLKTSCCHWKRVLWVWKRVVLILVTRKYFDWFFIITGLQIITYVSGYVIILFKMLFSWTLCVHMCQERLLPGDLRGCLERLLSFLCGKLSLVKCCITPSYVSLKIHFIIMYNNVFSFRNYCSFLFSFAGYIGGYWNGWR